MHKDVQKVCSSMSRQMYKETLFLTPPGSRCSGIISLTQRLESHLSTNDSQAEAYESYHKCLKLILVRPNQLRSSTLSSGPKSASSRIPLSACGKHTGSQKLRAQTNSRLGTEATDGPIPQRFNSTSTSSSDTEKRRTPTHSRSLSQPAQSGSKPNAQSGTESTQRKLRTKSETLYATQNKVS